MQISNILFSRIYTFLCYSIIIGATLIFSTATRSVFEVNKLGILKIALSLMGIIYAYDRLIGTQSLFHHYTKNKWFNHTLIIVWSSNVISTIFSKNPIISIFGCYDRWEGLLTMSVYLFLTYLIANKTGVSTTKKIVWCIIIASGLSSLYGIVQSYGLDIVSWSLDPSMRVFGSINNPVHYCAIMGMSIPIILGQIFTTLETKNHTKINIKSFGLIIAYYIFIGIISQFFTPLENSMLWIQSYILVLGAPYILYGIKHIKAPCTENLFNILFNSLILVIYATYLSYSRATWLGLTATIGLMFTITLITKINLSKRTFLVITLGCLILTMTLYLTFLFNLYTISLTTLILLKTILAMASGFILLPFKNQNVWKNTIQIILLIGTQFIFTNALSPLILIGFVAMSLFNKKTASFALPTTIVAFIILLMNIQFIGMSNVQLINTILILIGIIINETTTTIKNPFGNNPIFQWKLITVILIGLMFTLPNIYKWTASSDQNSSTSILIEKASEKINSYQNVAIDGTARTSMWKSAIPWISDHPIIGTGLDTIKYYFPKYRRPEYGKLEGGHNFTPDRLHNEYLNVLATKGWLGFICHYIIFIGGTITSLLIYIHKKKTNQQFLIVGLIGGSFVYLGQVLFNFGVVATLVYFFLFIGIGVSFKCNDETP